MKCIASRICWGYVAFVFSMVGHALCRELQSPCVRACRFEANSDREAQRVIIQHIKGNTHMWEEHEMDDGCMCIVQILPEEGHLNEGDAARLLQISVNWTMDTNMIKLKEMEASLLGNRALDPVNLELPWKDLDREMTVLTNKSETFLVSKMDTVGVPVRNTMKYPWYTAGRLFIEYEEFYSACSFILLSPYLAMTNAHCIFSDDGEISEGVLAAPAQYINGRWLQRPYGTMSACAVIPMSLYDPLNDTPDSFGYDYAGVIFPSSETPSELDKMTFIPLQFDRRIQTGDILKMAAYSSDQMFGFTGGVSSFTFDSSINANGRILFHAMPCEKGTSGGPIWVNHSKSPRLIALNAGSISFLIQDSQGGYTLSRNVGARFVPEDKDTILRWLDTANKHHFC